MFFSRLVSNKKSDKENFGECWSDKKYCHENKEKKSHDVDDTHNLLWSTFTLTKDFHSRLSSHIFCLAHAQQLKLKNLKHFSISNFIAILLRISKYDYENEIYPSQTSLFMATKRRRWFTFTTQRIKFSFFSCFFILWPVSHEANDAVVENDDFF